MAEALKPKKSSLHLSSTWKLEKSHVGAYSGGKVQVFDNMQYMACQFDDTVKILHIESGAVQYSLKDLEPAMAAETLVCFALHPNGNEVVTASKNGLLRRWNLGERRCVRAWKSVHTSPVLSMDYDSTGTLVATGGSDKTVQVWDVEKGYATHMFRGHAGIVHSTRFHPDPRHLLLFTFSDDCTIKVWDLNRHKCAATLSDHLSPATCMVFSPDGQTFVTGGRDGVLICWALDGFRVLKTIPVYEIVEAICCLPNYRSSARKRLAKRFCFATAGRAGVVKIWQLGLDSSASASTSAKKRKKKRPAPQEGNGKLVCELLLQESNERTSPSAPDSGVGGGITPLTTAALMRQREQQRAANAALPVKKRGKKNRKKARGALQDAGHGTAEKEGYSGLFLLEPDTLVAVTHDHNFHFKDSSSPHLTQLRQVMGFNDEILDIKHIPDAPSGTTAATTARRRLRVAVATNSEHVQVVDLSNFDTTLLTGHSAMVVAIAVSPDGSMLASTSKDATCRIWKTCERRSRCLAVCRGHTAAVGAVCFPNRDTSLCATGPAFLATASADMSVKLWDLRPVVQQLQRRRKSKSGGADEAEEEEGEGAEPLELRVLSSVAAHKKDINSVSMSPNDQLLASASQDKRVALWRVSVRSGDDVSLVEAGRLEGHRRGVWCATFSPVDKVLATGSADRTIRVWSVATHECLQTLEGHSASVLKVCFLRGGVQLMSAGGDGLLKLWTLRSNECVNTFDAHDDKIWALEILPPGDSTDTEDGDNGEKPGEGLRFISGASDSALKIWYDATSEVEDAEIGQREEFVRREQEMLNAYRSGQYARSIVIALEIDQPLRLRGLFEKLLGENTLALHLGKVPTFTPVTLTRLLMYVRDWNTNTRFCAVAQAVLTFLLTTFSFDDLRKAVREAGSTGGIRGAKGDDSGDAAVSLHDLLSGLVAYSERHLKRAARVYQSSFLVEYTLRSMQKLLPQQALLEAPSEKKTVEQTGPPASLPSDESDDE